MALDQLYQQFFQVGPIPVNAMTGEYNLYLVLLSYIIATIVSYVALDMSAHLRRPATLLFRISWLGGGALVMGAGIWSMHFVGMLAFIMPMPMTYNLFWTGLSMFIAVLTAAIAFIFFTIKHPRPIHYLMSGIILGAAIPAMHYTGMAGMEGMEIHYTMGLFCLSILIAVVAATASIWLSIKSDYGTLNMRVCLKLVSALIMGLAITGMHYAGMFAAIFTHLDHAHGTTIAMDPILLSIFITTIVISILLVALILSTTRYLYVTTVKNKTDFLMAVLNNMWGGVVACDATGKITLANRVATELFGDMEKLESAQWLEKNPMILNKTGKKAKLEEYPLYRALHGENVRDIEVVAKDQLGERHILVVDGQALVSAADGEKLGAVVVWNDISKSTAAEESSKAKSSFLANMSHEIRTPLNGVMGMLQIIMATPLNEKQKGLVQKSLDCSNSLLEILGDILDFSKIEAGKVALENISFDLKQELGALMTINEVQCAKKKLK